MLPPRLPCDGFHSRKRVHPFLVLSLAFSAGGCSNDDAVTPENNVAKVPVVSPASLPPGRTDSTDNRRVANPSAKFTLNVTALGTKSAKDTSEATPVSGASVSLTKVATANGDTVTTNTDAGSGTTDSAGRLTFLGVPTGYFYVLRATPPAASSYQAGRIRFAPAPTDTVVTTKVWMPQNP